MSTQDELANLVSLTTVAMLDANDAQGNATAQLALTSLDLLLKLSEDVYAGRGIPSIITSSEFVVSDKGCG